MPSKAKDKVRKIKAGMGTAGMLTSLGLGGAGVGLTIYARNIVSAACSSATSGLGTLTNSLVNRTINITMPSIDFTTNIPREVPFNANTTVHTPYGDFPTNINGTAVLGLPETLVATLSPIIAYMKDIIAQTIGEDAVDYLYSFINTADASCDSYIPDAIMVIGILMTVFFVYQASQTFFFGSKAWEHDTQFEDHRARLVDLEAGLNELKKELANKNNQLRI